MITLPFTTASDVLALFAEMAVSWVFISAHAYSTIRALCFDSRAAFFFRFTLFLTFFGVYKLLDGLDFLFSSTWILPKARALAVAARSLS